MRHRTVLLGLIATAAVVAGIAVAVVGPWRDQRSAAAPTLQVTTLESGLSLPWDLTFTPDGTMLFTERPGSLWVRPPNGPRRQLTADLSDVFVGSESGLLGLVVDPAFTANRRFYTCMATKAAHDTEVIRWHVDAGYTTATQEKKIVTGIPLTSGQHGGCRLRFDANGYLHVGTGDAITGTNPQNLNSLGGKTLRVTTEGVAAPGNPFIARGGRAALVYTYGHRNVQGLALRPGTNQMWTVEHGPGVDDEVNLEQAGGNYGWDPVDANGGGYNQDVPMTDTKKFPHAIPAKWSSGNPTIAPSGGAFITGSAWGRWQGALAVGILKDTGLMILTINAAGTVVKTERAAAVENRFGRIREPVMGPDGSLYLTTSNGGTGDYILKLTPKNAPQAYRAGLDVSPVGVSAARWSTDATTVMIRGTDGRPAYRTRSRSTAGFGPWHTVPGATITSAPALVSWGGQRLDLFGRGADAALKHWWYDAAGWHGPQSLGGAVTSAPAAASLASGTIDVMARTSGDALARIRYAGGAWGSWQAVGGTLTSAPSISANRFDNRLFVYARNRDGYIQRAVLTTTGTESAFAATATQAWSARGVGAAPTSSLPSYTVDVSYDGAPVLARGASAFGINDYLTGAPALVMLSGNAFALFGRGQTGNLKFYDGRPGAYRTYDLGGRVA